MVTKIVSVKSKENNACIFVFLNQDKALLTFCFSFFVIGCYGFFVKLSEGTLHGAVLGLMCILLSLVISWAAVFRHAIKRALRSKSGITYDIDFERKIINEFIGDMHARTFKFNNKKIKVSRLNKDGSGSIEIGGELLDLLENKTADLFQSLDLDENPITFILYEVENVESLAKMLES